MAGVTNINLPNGMSMDEFISDLRCFLRDHAELNRLLELQEGQESTNDQLILATKMAIDDWRLTTPLSSSVPPYKLLLLGAAIETLRSAMAFYTRNQLNYSDGGINVSVEDKAPGLTNLLNLYERDYEAKKRAYKIYINASKAYGDIPSEYSYIPQNNF